MSIKNSDNISLSNHPYRVLPNTQLSLKEFDANDDELYPIGKEEGKALIHGMTREIGDLQEILYAEGKQKLLIVLQAMDAGGKDGTIRNVFKDMDARGLRVASFNKPSHAELARDYLWRVHSRVPKQGECVIFNRSHYEDIVAVRVRKLKPEKIWSNRYQHIVNFEKMLVDEGTTILKFFLHISADEQKRRLQERLDDPTKHWKLHPDDFNDRLLWNDFQGAYEDVLSKTSTRFAPWFVIPANRKWYRNLVVAQILIQALKKMDMKLPPPDFDASSVSLV